MEPNPRTHAAPVASAFQKPKKNEGGGFAILRRTAEAEENGVSIPEEGGTTRGACSVVSLASHFFAISKKETNKVRKQSYLLSFECASRAHPRATASNPKQALPARTACGASRGVARSRVTPKGVMAYVGPEPSDKEVLKNSKGEWPVETFINVGFDGVY